MLEDLAARRGVPITGSSLQASAFQPASLLGQIHFHKVPRAPRRFRRRTERSRSGDMDAGAHRRPDGCRGFQKSRGDIGPHNGIHRVDNLRWRHMGGRVAFVTLRGPTSWHLRFQTSISEPTVDGFCPAMPPGMEYDSSDIREGGRPDQHTEEGGHSFSKGFLTTRPRGKGGKFPEEEPQVSKAALTATAASRSEVTDRLLDGHDSRPVDVCRQRLQGVLDSGDGKDNLCKNSKKSKTRKDNENISNSAHIDGATLPSWPVL